MCVDTGSQSHAGEGAWGWRKRLGEVGGPLPHYFRGDEQLVALEVFSELTQVAAVGDFFPKLVTEEEAARE